MPSADEIRDAQRVTWAGLSAGWEKWDSVIMEQLGPVGAAIIESLDIAEDHQHLDIASGTGEPGLSIARLSPKGRVVLTDLVAEMLDVAVRRARAQGIANIETRVASADDLPFDDGTFDSVSVRFGYMFFPDVAKAAADSGERDCQGDCVREGREGPGSGRGAVHRRNETGRKRAAPSRRLAILQHDPAVGRGRITSSDLLGFHDPGERFQGRSITHGSMTSGGPHIRRDAVPEVSTHRGPLLGAS